MNLLRYELKKLLTLPMLWVLVALCLLLNLCITLGYRYKVMDYDFFSYVTETASQTGTVLGDDFTEKLSALPERPEKSRLLAETTDLSAIYEDYDATALADAYIGLYGVSGIWAELLTAKYEKLQASVGALAQCGAEFSLYGADVTTELHDLLFGVVLRAVLTEACLFGVFSMLYLLSYEQQNRTAWEVCTTKTGRGIFRYKLSAGLLAAVIGYALIAEVTLLVYFSVFDYSWLWNVSVSSGFNYVSELIGRKPFLTWVPLTVRSYLLAVLGLGLGLTLVFALMGAFIGALSPNSYMGVVLFFLLALAMMTVPYLFSETGIWGGYFVTELSPMCLWFVSPRWLTDLGSVSVLPFHETVGIGFNLLLWGLLVWGADRYNRKRDVV